MTPSKRILCVILAICLSITLVTARSSLLGRADAAPRGCKWQRLPGTDTTQNDTSNVKHMLQCKLRTISGIDNLLSNLSVYQTDRISAMRLECSDVLFFESSLETNNQHAGVFLSALRNLNNLTIEFCKIRYVPSMVLQGLRNLRILSLRTHNSDWNPMNLELHPECFRGLTELQDLDLSDNNIWSLPTEVFCPLYSLKYLNLTKNRLTDIAQLGFAGYGSGSSTPGKACNTGLEVLDLSHNDISTLPDNGLSALRSLTQLHLQENLLIAIADRALAGLQSLNVLNISSNRLVALPRELFHASPQLTQLYVQNNTLTALAPGLLERLDHLEVLDLSQNELTSTWINSETFSGLVRLVVLNLGHNELTKIDQFVFRGLYSLQILHLDHNSIDTIETGAFVDLKNLHALTLSTNNLKRIESHHFTDLYVLNQLFLESNQIESIDENAFENLTNLNDLSLNDNLLNEIPSCLQKLHFLKSLDLGKNRIDTLHNDSFDGLRRLLGLRLVDNLLTTIARDTFIKLSSIHVLNLASNQIKQIDQSAFSSNPTLRAIRLDNNQIQDISSVFTSLNSLVWLNVSDNNIHQFDYSHLPASLEWLDIHKNNLTRLGNYFDVRNITQIKMLDVSYNNLVRIDDSSIPNSIQTLYLNNNKIREVAPGTFLKKRHLDKVVLYGNQIRELDISAFALNPISDTKEMPAFYIGDNPIHANCKMEWLQRINEISHLRQHPRVLDLDLVMCTMEHERNGVTVVRPLMDLKPQDFLCKYESHCFALCHCCDFEACDCKMTCPDRCSCYHDHTWSANVVDCGNAGYTKVPERLPMDATTIFLDGNDLGDLSSHMFIGKKKLEQLYLNNSKITSLHNRTFNGVPSLKVLHLENNQIEELRGFEFDQLKNLNELYLSENVISHIGNNTFGTLKKLEVLALNHNKINNFAPWHQLTSAYETGSLAQLTLEGNSWHCDCETLLKLNEWIKEFQGEFDVNRMMCSDNKRIVGEIIKQCEEALENGSATSAVQRTVIGNGLIGGSYVPLLAAVLVSIIGAGLLIALVCVLRQDFRLWAHAKYGIRLFKDPTQTPGKSAEEGDQMYDAYFIYSIRDSDFVLQVIASELHNTGYNLCLHHRDIHASAYLNDSLQSASDISKKIIIVVSMAFLQNEWSQPTFRLALQSVIENIRPSYRRHKIALILTAPLELIVMDATMQLLVQTCPVICWGEKRCWDKIRFALPDLPSHNRSIKKLGTVSRSPNLRYTPAPTTLDSWCKNHPGFAVPMNNSTNISMEVVEQMQQQAQHNQHQQHVHQQQQQQQQHQQKMTQDQLSLSPISLSRQSNAATSPSHSMSMTEDELSCTSSHYEPANTLQHQTNYVCRSTASSLGHVYSTIPETPQMNRNGRAYFV